MILLKIKYISVAHLLLMNLAYLVDLKLFSNHLFWSQSHSKLYVPEFQLVYHFAK